VLTAAFDRIAAVPAISRFLGIVIAMFFDDHGPPHFHARHADGSAKIRIDTLEPIETTLGRRQSAARARLSRTAPGRTVRELAPRARR
jgi:Domain of unknown function (DUF4160)